MKLTNRFLQTSRTALTAAAASLVISAPLRAGIVLIDGFDGGSAVINPTIQTVDLSGGAGAPLLSYTPSVNPVYDNTLGWGSANLNNNSWFLDGPGGVYIPATNSNINGPNQPLAGSFDLIFGSVQSVMEMAVYLGYDNRHAGSYLIKDGAGTVRGEFASNGPEAGSFLARFTTPFTTDKLTVEFAATGNGADGFTTSYAEIQVFGVPEPSTAGILMAAVLGGIACRRRTLRA